MTLLPATHTPLRPVAPGPEERAAPAPADPAQPAATQRAWLDDLRRISALHAELAAVTAALVQNLEAAVAAEAEQSDMSRVAPIEPTQPDLLTTADMTALLRCDARTLRRRELLGEIPAPVRQGRLKRWHRKTVQRWLEENTQ